MKQYILDNGIKLLYYNEKKHITSFSVGFEAGALCEDKYYFGTAHVVEHMLFKKTKSKDEDEINKIINRYFGFNNAMTNYPYAIYYGTCLSEFFNNAFEIYSDIILNPCFEEKLLEEEKKIIYEELNQWDADPCQRIEDEIYKNAFKKRRIRDKIIGNYKSLSCIDVDHITKFYNEFYIPSNCVISVSSNLSFENILSVVEKYFCDFKGENKKEIAVEYENACEGIFTSNIYGLNGVKLKYIFSIDGLNKKDIQAFKIFNEYFGEGVCSLLFDELRTKHNLVYDVYTELKQEKGIKLYSINLSCSEENLEKIRAIIEGLIDSVKNIEFKQDNIFELSKKIILKNTLNLERTIDIVKMSNTYEIMNINADIYWDINMLNKINSKDISQSINKVFKYNCIQILS
ncbi:MAG: M16 family metallopeptidase [Clostridiaceae bacterium]